MAINFNSDEIFEMAEQIERNGAKFYRKAAQNLTDAQGRKLLLDLASMEDQHLKIFIEMQTKLTHREKEEMIFDPDQEAAMYLQAMADGHVFNIKADPATLIDKSSSVNNIFKTAIEFEKDSIIFYVGLRDMVPLEGEKNKIDAIIREEMGHIAILNRKMASKN